jgi:tetratricopeptide (TPR) repeat protein
MAESAFAKAVRLDRSMVSIDEVVSHLDKAATLNKYNDVYYRNLAQALLYKLDEVVAEDADGQTETDNTQLIQVLTSSSINAAKRATDVSPYNVLNWRVRGSVYRELMAFVSGADQFAKLSFERATQLEPNNPVGFVGLGRTHLATAALASKSLNSQDDSVRTQARQVINSELASAEEALRTAISLKSDYAQSHFYLALVFEEQGRLDEAFAKLDAVRQYNPLDVGVAFQMGQLAMRMEKYDRARLEFEHAIKLSPEFANARWFLASVYEIDGDADAAIEQIGEILKLQPNNEVARARLERLEEGKIKLSLPEPLSDGESVEIKQ